jgi:hypothetical protein
MFLTTISSGYIRFPGFVVLERETTVSIENGQEKTSLFRKIYIDTFVLADRLPGV